MTLTFPNSTRSYDEVHQRVRFRGYDGMFEVQFLVPIDVLESKAPGRLATGADYLAAFDASMPRILKAATSAYGKRRSSMIVLDRTCFR